MAILTMKQVEILAMLTDSKDIIDFVQRQGNMEIHEYRTEENEADHFYKLPTASTVNQFHKFRDAAERAEEVLGTYVPAKGGLAASLSGREELSLSDFLERSKEVEEILGICYDINGCQKQIQDARADIVRSETLIDQLNAWKNLDIPTSFRGTHLTSTFIGSIGEPLDREQVLTRLAETAPELQGEIEIVSSDKNQTCLVALCHKDDAVAFEQALRSIGFTTVTETSKLLPGERIEKLQKHREEREEEIARAEDKIRSYGDERDRIRFLQDYFTIRMEKYEVFDKILMDENVFVLTGYVPEGDAERLKEELESHYSAAVSITDVDLSEGEEDVPVEVKNNRYTATMQRVTNMYSPPSHHDVDPNPLMSVLYYCLFGLMLGDAGYGLLMILLMVILKLKYKNMDKGKRDFVNYGLFCGIGTTVWGALQNSWFGDLPKWIANGLHSNDPTDFISVRHLYWFEPMAYNNITRFLMLCFAIGIIHLFFGICINIVKNIRQKNAFVGIVENVPFLLILVGVLPVINKFIGGTALVDVEGVTDPFNHTQPIYDFLTNNATNFYYILGAGAILVWLTPVLVAIHDHKPVGKVFAGFLSGLYGIYNAASGYLGDILSYARLLALGLCTGVIASVINQLAATPLGGNPIIFIVIFVLGHAVNLAINLIGAYVHTNRLQYVEFFSKFYEGGGKPFEPLKASTKSFKFKEEN